MESDQQEVWEMTFTDWVAAGAAFGIKAFFAVFVFLMCCGVILGLFAFLAACFGGDDE